VHRYFDAQRGERGQFIQLQEICNVWAGRLSNAKTRNFLPGHFCGTHGACPGTTIEASVKILRMQDHLAHRLAAREHLEGVGGLRQREGAVDMR
jgi:hypothetical protein